MSQDVKRVTRSGTLEDQIISPYERNLRALTDSYAVRAGIEKEQAFLDLQTFIDSDTVLALDLHNAVMYLSCVPKEEATYERFCAILVGDPDRA